MINVMLVDDHDIVRAGIKRLLDDVSGIRIVGEANSGEQAVVAIRQVKADVVVMDIKMPGIGGLEATRRLLRMDPDLKVIALSVCNDDLFPQRLLQAGAVGYLTKACSLDQMVVALRKVHAGQRYISPDIAQRLALKQVITQDKSPLTLLSERELQILMMIISGLKVQEISIKLCLSPKTVNSYRYRLFKKLAVNGDVELTLLAIRYGLLENADFVAAVD